MVIILMLEFIVFQNNLDFYLDYEIYSFVRMSNFNLSNQSNISKLFLLYFETKQIIRQQFSIQEKFMSIFFSCPFLFCFLLSDNEQEYL